MRIADSGFPVRQPKSDCAAHGVSINLVRYDIEVRIHRVDAAAQTPRGGRRRRAFPCARRLQPSHGMPVATPDLPGSVPPYDGFLVYHRSRCRREYFSVAGGVWKHTSARSRAQRSQGMLASHFSSRTCCCALFSGVGVEATLLRLAVPADQMGDQGPRYTPRSVPQWA